MEAKQTPGIVCHRQVRDWTMESKKRHAVYGSVESVIGRISQPIQPASGALLSTCRGYRSWGGQSSMSAPILALNVAAES